MSRKQNKQKAQNNLKGIADKAAGYLWNMRRAPGIDKNMGIVQTLPLIFFTAAVIMIVRMTVYTRKMDQFYWALNNVSADFFSYYKMAAIITCAAAVLLFLLYRAITKTLAIKRTFLYIPMLAYTLFVILSYAFSEYREFSLLGYNERFEGTLVLLSYMVMLFYAINTVNTEKNVKYVLYPVAVSSFILSLIGISQAIGQDFFRTRFAGMLIFPKSHWDKMGKSVFMFDNNEIYQTVYNINYVSFYLTLLLPIFGLLFINSIMKGKQEKLSRKIIWGVLVVLIVFNMIGSASSGWYPGIGIAAVLAAVILHKKILSWWKPLAVMAGIVLIIGGITFNRWFPELTDAVRGALTSDLKNPTGNALKGMSYIDYLEVISEENTIKLSIDGNELEFLLHSDDGVPRGLDIFDAERALIGLKGPNNEKDIIYMTRYSLDDDRFTNCSIRLVRDKEGQSYMVITTDDQDWRHLITSDGVYYINVFGKRTEMKKVDAIGFKKNQGFGSGRGYIWSRTIPIMIDTILIGRGADTYCIYFPQNDYAGKYNAGFGHNAIVDKPHNMYMQMSIGTGGISLVAFLVLLAVYFAQSFKIYRNRQFESFLEFAGLGIFLGVAAFSVSALVNDSTVSVMPLFYGLLGTGIAVNIMFEKTKGNTE